MRPCLCREKNLGFTLIELLVVISIIALLVGILLPALGSARDVAISAKCLANQHGIGIAMANYEADNLGCLAGIQQIDQYASTDSGEGGGYSGPGELGAVGVDQGAHYEGSRTRGWASGSLIYTTFTKGQGADRGGVPGEVGTDGPVTAQSITSPYSATNPREYGAPCGIGYLAQYCSPTGNASDSDGRIFYCPGTTASFGPFGGNQYWASGSILPLVPQGTGLYNTFKTDWEKVPGGGTFGSFSNPMVWSTYFYRSGTYYDTVDASGRTITAGHHDDWHSMLAANDLTGDAYPRSDSTYLPGESYLVCDSWIAAYYVSAFGPQYPFGLGDIASNICHRGKSVNRAFHDGSSSSFAIPLGHKPPYESAVLTDGFYCAAPFTSPGSFFSYFCDDGNGIGDGFEALWPYYWVILDNKAPYPNP